MKIQYTWSETIQTTMNIYAHVTKSSKDKTADKLSSYIDF